MASSDTRYQKIVVTGFLVRDDKALIAKRSERETFLPGYYDLPGGKCDFGEDLIAALKREFQEEMRLDIEILRPYRTFSYLSDNNQRHTVEIVFLVTESHPDTIQLNKDHTEYAWVDEADIVNYPITDETKASLLEGFTATLFKVEEGKELE